MLAYWLPPILWMGAILFFSTDSFSGENTGSVLQKIFAMIYPGLTKTQFDLIHFFVRKAAHFVEYAILALLLFRAFRSGSPSAWDWRWAICSLAIVAIYSLLDEYRQSFTANRFGSIYDSMIDTVGGATSLALLWFSRWDSN